MATYKEIKGVTVQTRDSDPVIGGLPGGSWSAGGDLSSSPYWLMGGGMGISTSSALASGGNPGSTNNELYNGTSWTEVNNLNTGGDGIAPAGTATAGLAIGGRRPSPANVVESWDGTNYTEIAEINTARSVAASFGTQTAALVSGGDTPPYSAVTEIWNGSTWTEVNDTSYNRGHWAGAGTTTAGVANGGGDPFTGVGESWDGTSWTTTPIMNNIRYGLASSGNGTQTSMILFGGIHPGTPTGQTNTESYNGTTWTEINNMATARYYLGGAGTSSSALAFGGLTTTGVANTEEWTTAPVTAATLTEGDIFLSGGTTLKGFGRAAGIPSGSWGSGGNLNTARGDGLYGFGTTSAAGVAGGDDGTPGDSWVANTEIYNGSTWSEQADLNTGRYFCLGSGGTTTAAIGVSGRTTANIGNTETWNGSAWTETTDINTTRRGVLSNQPPSAQTQIVVYSGYTTTQTANTESWDGSTWTELSDLNSARYTGGDGGSGPGDAICAGGQPASPGKICEFWDGTSWSEGADLNTVRIEGAASGATSTSVIYGGGNNPSASGFDTVEYYNGSSWTEIADLADGGNGASHHIGSAHDTFFVGGSPPSGVTNSTEHFTADNALADITVS